jgi:hypothetical protein
MFAGIDQALRGTLQQRGVIPDDLNDLVQGL